MDKKVTQTATLVILFIVMIIVTKMAFTLILDTIPKYKQFYSPPYSTQRLPLYSTPSLIILFCTLIKKSFVVLLPCAIIFHSGCAICAVKAKNKNIPIRLLAFIIISLMGFILFSKAGVRSHIVKWRKFSKTLGRDTSNLESLEKRIEKGEQIYFIDEEKN